MSECVCVYVLVCAHGLLKILSLRSEVKDWKSDAFLESSIHSLYKDGPFLDYIAYCSIPSSILYSFSPFLPLLPPPPPPPLCPLLLRDVKTSVTTNNDRGHQNALSSTHSQSHEHIPKMGGVDGVSYSGDHTNNDVRGEISAGSYMQSSHGRNGSASQPALNPRGHTRSHSGAGSGVIPIPRDMKHFRSMSIGSGTPPALTPISGGNLSVSYSHSAELRQLAALTSKPQSMGSSGSVTMDSHKTPPQRRGNYGRHDLKGQHLLPYGNLQGGCGVYSSMYLV